MSNKQKTTNYFSHDSNARNDEKLVRLRMKIGPAGYGVYFMLLERLREEKNYMSVKDYNMIAFDLRVDAALVKTVVEDFGLFAFTDDGKCFYSESFARRMDMMDTIRQRRSRAGKKAMQKRWADKQQEDRQEEHTAAHNNSSRQPKPAAKPKAKPKQKPKAATPPKDSESPTTSPQHHTPAITTTPPTDNPQTNVDDKKCLAHFFRAENRASIETLLMNLGLQPADEPLLHTLAKDVLAEWRLTDKHHDNYSDWARHLVATIRLRIQAKPPAAAAKKKPAAKEPKQPPKPTDYTYSGGFGSKDV